MRRKGREWRNPLADYRRIQGEMRRLFDPFTEPHCPTCATPCCVKPTRVTPFDVALAIGAGHRFHHLASTEAFAPALADAAVRLSASSVPLPMAADGDSAPMCEYLVGGRCSFPDDLRPYGCATFLCKPMYAHMPEETLRKLKRLSRQLADAHAALLRAISRGAGSHGT